MGENHIEGLAPSNCVGHCVTHIADPDEVRRLDSILGTSLPCQRELPEV